MKEFVRKLSAILESALKKFRRPCPRPKKPQIISLRGTATYLWLALIPTAWTSRYAYIEAAYGMKCNFSYCYNGFFSKSYSFIHGDKHKTAKVSELLCYAVCHFTVPESHFCHFWPPSDSCTLSLVVLFSAVTLLYILVAHLPSSKEQNSLFFLTVSVTVSSVYISPLVSSFHILYFVANSTLLTWSTSSSVFLSHLLDMELCLYDRVVYRI